MDPNALAQQIVDGIGTLLDKLGMFLTAEQRRLLDTDRRYWQQADDAAKAKLLDAYNAEAS